MSIDKQGFLSEDINKWSQKIRSKYSQYFSLYYDFNNYAQDLAFKLTAHNNNLDELLIACLYIRTLSSYQSLFILLEKGIIHEAKIILRSLIEVLFQLVAINKNNNLSINYVFQDSLNRKKLTKKVKNYKSDIIKEYVSLDLDKLQKQIDDEISKKNIKKLTTYDFAVKADLLDFYNTAYVLLSSTVHASSRDIENHLIINKDKIIESFNWGPSDKDIDMLLISGIETLYIILLNVIKRFQIEKSSIFINLEKRYTEQKDIYRKARNKTPDNT